MRKIILFVAIVGIMVSGCEDVVAPENPSISRVLDGTWRITWTNSYGSFPYSGVYMTDIICSYTGVTFNGERLGYVENSTDTMLIAKLSFPVTRRGLFGPYTAYVTEYLTIQVIDSKHISGSYGLSNEHLYSEEDWGSNFSAARLQ